MGAWFGGGESEGDRPVELASDLELHEDAGMEDRLLRLEQIIAEEREARITLEDTLAMLFEEFERLEGAGGRAAAERQAEEQRQREARAIERGSPGNNAGIQAGDHLVSYNGERIFNVAELRDQTLQGNPGEDVVIEIERDGTRMQLTIPRGPIGITGSGANVRGMNWWGG